MRKENMKRILAVILAAALAFIQPISVLAEGGGVTQSEDTLTSTGTSDWTTIKKPSTTGNGISTWDCIWFGNYWQEDTNNDGHCYAEKTTVNGTTYYADDKQPIKWRILDIDTDGNALLLADKLIDVVQYNETETDVTWKTCTMRSYLNGYGANENVCNKDFSTECFATEAFTDSELNSIKQVTVENPDNPIYGTEGGDDTEDRLFCLSIDEVMTGNYGFLANEFTSGFIDELYMTAYDPTRVAYTTCFTRDKPGYSGYYGGPAQNWWLRSPGYRGNDASNVIDHGVVDALGWYLSLPDECVRPAFRMNLSTSSSHWKYAGTVSSDGTVDQTGLSVKGVFLNGPNTIKKGISTTLTPEIVPADADDLAVEWRVVAGTNVVTVADNGVVTANKEGSATVQVKTNDGGYTATCEVTVVSSDSIAAPVTMDDKITWDCIWFGNYWQEDTNNDGQCFSRDTVITKADDGFPVDQDGARVDYSIELGTYPADDKQPIKWRVLDIDTDGNALLLADKLIDIVQYNTTSTDVTWKSCTMRSYLNGYGEDENVSNIDFSKNSFAGEAFTDDEWNIIKRETIVNPDNPVYGRKGGDPTEDKLFCLSIGESMKRSNGFLENEFTNTSFSNTDGDPTRTAITTLFTDNKPGYDGNTAGGSDEWWLRSPGGFNHYASTVNQSGAINAGIYNEVNSYGVCLRPAFRMNLSTSSSLWKYAGTVCSDGTEILPPDPMDNIHKPLTTEDGVSTWDCVWFGTYWQDTDSNSDMVVTKEDSKDPIKWRVLDIDENGNALLLSDRLIDIFEYNTQNTSTSWATSALRYFLNSTGSYSATGFLNNAFTAGEIEAITDSSVTSVNNPVYGTSGGNSTTDKVFCLSTAEAMSEEYGFQTSDFTLPDSSAKKYRTESDPSRVAVNTWYTYGKSGYNTNKAGEPANWWLRTPGYTGYYTSGVYFEGNIDVNNYFGLQSNKVSVRPALRINLAAHPDLWSYAGTVSSDGTKSEERTAVTRVSLPSKETVNLNKTITLMPEIFPANATEKRVTWRTADNTVATVDKNGVVTGVSTGSVIIYVTTVDGDHTDSCEVSVVIPATGVTVSEKKKTIMVGGSTALDAKVIPDDATNKDVTWGSSNETVALVNNKGVVTGIGAGSAEITATTVDGGFTDSCTVNVMKAGDLTKLKAPETTTDGLSTWECVWFGEYWQETDSTGDGKVTREDVKDPIKWRVLELDANGNALLLSDKLLDISYYTEYDKGIAETPDLNTSVNVSWVDSIPRSFLNSYKGVDSKRRDYSSDGFLNNAFSQPEINAIKDTSITGSVTVNTTIPFEVNDKVFCLSVGDAMNGDYGFISNEFTYSSTQTQSLDAVQWYYTDTDPDNARKSSATSYLVTRTYSQKKVDDHVYSYSVWWLRSPDYGRNSAAYVGNDGVLRAFYNNDYSNSQAIFLYALRPALRINLKNNQTLWSYAGRVRSDGRVTEKPVEGITLPAKESVEVDRTVTLEPVFTPGDASLKNVSWVSSNNDIATVDQYGVVLGRSMGDAVITARSDDGGHYATCIVTVGPLRVRKVLLPEKKTIKAGDVITLTPVITPENATDCTVFWTSSDEAVATVDEKGNVTGVYPGTVEIKATTRDGGLTAICLVKVNPLPVSGVSLPASQTIWINETVKLIPEITPEGATDQTVTWNSTDDGIVSVDDSGNITGVSAGKAVITVKTNDGGHVASCLVVVDDKVFINVTDVSLPENRSIKPGESITLTPVITPANATNQKVVWSNSDETVATLSGNGIVTGVKAGVTDVTVTTENGGHKAVCRVTVTEQGEDPINPDDPVVDLDEDIIFDVDKEDLTVDMLPGEVRRLSPVKGGRYIYGIKWTTAEVCPKGAISVKNGVVTAKKKLGYGEVTATYRNQSVTFIVYVDDDVPDDVIPSGKDRKLTAPKTVKLNVGNPAKTVTLGLPKDTPNLQIDDPVVTAPGVCEVKQGDFNAKGNKFTFTVTPVDAGSTWIIWTVIDLIHGNKYQAYTKILVKKPVTTLSVNGGLSEIKLDVGEGRRIAAYPTEGNTEPKDLSFSVQGKGIKVSKSGYVVAMMPGASGNVTVKAGKVIKTVRVQVSNEYAGNYILLNKTSVNAKVPRSGSKAVKLKLSIPKKATEQPPLGWEILGFHDGITVNRGVVSIGSNAKPGCYSVAAFVGDEDTCTNVSFCEVIVK